jgi:hypothetical protein
MIGVGDPYYYQTQIFGSFPVNYFKNVKTDYGAKGDGSTDDSGAFVAALNGTRYLFIPPGIYIINSQINIAYNDVVWRGCGYNSTGVGYNNTILQFGVSNADCITFVNGTSHIQLEDLQLSAPSLGAGKYLINAAGCSDVKMDKVYLSSGSNSNNALLRLGGTYGLSAVRRWSIERCRFEGGYYGILLGDNADSNTIRRCDFGVSSPQNQECIRGIITNLDYSRSAFIINNSFYGSGTQTGIDLQNWRAAYILGNFFSNLATGISLQAGCKDIYLPFRGNFFDSCTANLNPAAVDIEPTVLAQISFNGTTGSAIGTARGCSISRGSAGTYTLTLDRAMADAGWSLNVAGAAPIKLVSSKGTNTAVVITQTLAGTSTDYSPIDLTAVGVF